MTIEAALQGVASFAERIARTLQPVLEEEGRELLQHIRNELQGPGTRGGPFSGSDRLGTASGRLGEALREGGTGNIFKLTPPDKLTVGVSGTEIPYNLIHEHGGKITATPKMIAKLFHLARETGNEGYRWTALSARSKGHILIRPRPYFEPGVQEYKRHSGRRLERKITAVVEAEWKRWR